MTERHLLTDFSKKIKELRPTGTIVYEAKMVKAKSFRLASVAKHQVEGLLGALHGLWYKISDSPIYAGNKSRFTFKKPFDACWIKAEEAYIVPIFYIPRKKKTAYLIPVKEFVKIVEDSRGKEKIPGFPAKSIKSIKEADLGKFVSIEL